MVYLYVHFSENVVESNVVITNHQGFLDTQQDTAAISVRSI